MSPLAAPPQHTHTHPRPLHAASDTCAAHRFDSSIPSFFIQTFVGSSPFVPTSFPSVLLANPRYLRKPGPLSSLSSSPLPDPPNAPEPARAPPPPTLALLPSPPLALPGEPRGCGAQAGAGWREGAGAPAADGGGAGAEGGAGRGKRCPVRLAGALGDAAELGKPLVGFPSGNLLRDAVALAKRARCAALARSAGRSEAVRRRAAQCERARWLLMAPAC